MDHDWIFPWSTYLSRWLGRLRRDLSSSSTYNRQLSLVIIDIKTPLIIDIKTPQSLVGLREMVRRTLPSSVSVIFSIADISDKEAMIPLFGDQRAKEGFAINLMSK